MILKIVLAAACCAALSSCGTIKELRESEAIQKIGSFQLNPVADNAYWYNGTSYEYNKYEIKMTSEPKNVRVIWEDKYIGVTPFVYAFTGTIDKGDRITVRAIPEDRQYESAEAVLKVTQELPREVHFKLEKTG